MSALITRLQSMSDELYRASLETFSAMVTMYANDTGEIGLTVSGLDLKREQLALMNLDDLDAFIAMAIEARAAMQGVTA